MYATPGSYKIHLNSQITDRMVSSSATRFTSKAENIHGEDVSPLKEKAFENTKKTLGCLEFRRNSTSFYQLLLMEKNPAPLRMPEMYFFYKYQDLFSGILSGAGFCSINCITIGTQWKSSIGAHGNSSGKRGFWGQGADAEVGWAPNLCFWFSLFFWGGRTIMVVCFLH